MPSSNAGSGANMCATTPTGTAMTADNAMAGAAARHVAYHGTWSTRPATMLSNVSEMVFSITCEAATAAIPWSTAIKIAGNRIASCMMPVAVSNQDRPIALNTAPGMLAIDASPVQIATNVSGEIDDRYVSP